MTAMHLGVRVLGLNLCLTLRLLGQGSKRHDSSASSGYNEGVCYGYGEIDVIYVLPLYLRE
jgi:hypothetical protein